jgi:hypothetical protein
MITGNRQTPAASHQTPVDHEAASTTCSAPQDGPASQTERNRGDSMTQRERPSLETAEAPACGPAPLAPVVFAASASPSFWEQWYAQAGPEQRQQVLELARQQGVLCSTQLPAVQPAAPQRSLIADLLAGVSVRDRIEPLEPSPLDPIDTQLDEVQHQAVARALATPDIALIQGYPGSGKTRVVAELLRQSDRLGTRVLFVAPTAAAIDRTLERLASDPSMRLLRCLGNEETPTACVSRLSLPGRLRLYDEQTLPTARRALDEARATLTARTQDGQTWDRLAELVDSQTRLAADLATLEALPADDHSLVADIERTTWQARAAYYSEESRQLDDRIAQVRRELDRLSGERKQCEVQLQSLLPLAEARQHGRWWSTAYWRSFGHGNLQPRIEEIQSQCARSAEQLDALQHESDELAQKRQQLDARREQERKQVVEAELARRQGERETRLTELRQRLIEAQTRYRSACEGMCPGTTRPDKACLDSLTSARAAWQQQLAHDEQEVALRARWLDALEQTRPALPAHLAGSARIVATPLAALPADASGFDLLVVEEADRLSEADLLALSRRARRWVLVGEPLLELPQIPSPRRAVTRARRSPGSGRRFMPTRAGSNRAGNGLTAGSSLISEPSPRRWSAGCNTSQSSTAPKSNWGSSHHPGRSRESSGSVFPPTSRLRMPARFC